MERSASGSTTRRLGKNISCMSELIARLTPCFRRGKPKQSSLLRLHAPLRGARNDIGP